MSERLSPMEARARALQLKRDFVGIQSQQQKALDDAESVVNKEWNKKLFQRVAKEPKEVREAAALQDFYDDWSYAYNDDGSEAPTIVVPSIAEVQAAEQAENIRRAGEAKARKDDRKRGR